MELIKIDNISLSDCPILSVTLHKNNNEIDIVSLDSIRISDLKRFNETHLKIKNWKKLRLSKYVSLEPFGDGEHFEIDWKSNLETFDFIQEIILQEKTLTLNGFSKESGAWLTYEFVAFEYEISVT